MEKDAAVAEVSSLLTLREKEIISLLATGILNKEMALTLGLSLNTVRNHLKNIYRKIEVDNRVEAVIWYYRTNEES